MSKFMEALIPPMRRKPKHPAPMIMSCNYQDKNAKMALNGHDPFKRFLSVVLGFNHNVLENNTLHGDKILNFVNVAVIMIKH